MSLLLHSVYVVGGIILGVITGLAPAIHTNLVAAIVVSFAATSSLNPYGLALAIIALAVTHIVVDFVPTVFLGVPQEDTILSVLPSHTLVREGKGLQAIEAMILGSRYALVSLIVLVPAIYFWSNAVETFVTPVIGFILIGVLIYSICREEKIIAACLVTFVAGLLGYVTFNLPIKDPLLPLLTGLYGCSAILISFKESTTIPKQDTSFQPITIEEKKSALKAGMLAAFPFSFLPALGAGYASFIGAEIVPQTDRSFLMLNGFLSMITMICSVVLIAVIQKARTGASAAIYDLLNNISTEELGGILLTAVAVTLISSYLAMILAKKSAQIIQYIPYRLLTLVMLLGVLLINIYLTNF